MQGSEGALWGGQSSYSCSWTGHGIILMLFKCSFLNVPPMTLSSGTSCFQLKECVWSAWSLIHIAEPCSSQSCIHGECILKERFCFLLQKFHASLEGLVIMIILKIRASHLQWLFYQVRRVSFTGDPQKPRHLHKVTLQSLFMDGKVVLQRAMCCQR